MEVLDPASSAAACAAFRAEAVEVFNACGSGGPVFCMAGFRRNSACRSAVPTAGSIGRESTGRMGASKRVARPLFHDRKAMAAHISAAAANRNRKNPRRTVGLSSENVMHESSRCNLAVVKRGNDEPRSRGVLRVLTNRLRVIWEGQMVSKHFRASWLPRSSLAHPVASVMLSKNPLRRVLSVLVLLLASATAQAQFYVAPQLLYNDPGISMPLQTSAEAAFAITQSTKEYCSGDLCYSYVNLHTDPSLYLSLTWNGTYFEHWYDLQLCDSSGCTTYPDQGYIQTTYVCPAGANADATGYGESSDPEAITVWCELGYQEAPPPPVFCLSCVGNPIYASSGEKLQVEPDYSPPAVGMDFARTYRSDLGRMFSVANAAFADYSQPPGTPLSGCYTSYYTNTSTSTNVLGCFPYMSSGQELYQLATADGRTIQFSGPNSAVTQNADINERVTQIVTGGGATEWQVTRDDNSVELYAANGQLIQKTLRGGEVISYTYSTSSTSLGIAPGPGFLIGQSDPFGHTLSWTYNSLGQMTQMTDPAGGTYQYAYDGSGNLTSVTYPDSSSKTYWYNESANTGGASLPGALTGITDESGTRYATFQYAATYTGSPFGLAVNTQHAGGVDSYSVSYGGYGYYGGAITAATVTDPLGTSRNYHFEEYITYNEDTYQNQPAASGSGTVSKSENYDSNANPNYVSDYNGNVTTRVFDSTRNLETSRTEAYGSSAARTITTAWSSSFRLPTLITEPNRATSFSYDSSGNLLTKTITDTAVSPNVSRTWTYTYDGYGQVLTATGPRTDVASTTTYTYYTCTTGYQCGELHTVTDAVGNVTTYNTYNAHGQPLTITDPNGIVTTLTYDARLRMTSRQVGSETTSFSYYATGLLERVTLPDSSYIQYTYDGAHRLTQISDGAGNSIQYTLDAMGNRTAENTYDPSGALHRTHSRVYNGLSELYQDVNAAGTSAVTTTYAYDNDANQTGIGAPLSRNTADVYDPLNRLTQITDPASGVTSFSYDAESDLTAVQDPLGLTTGYSYNGFGDVTGVASPDTGTTAKTYDSGGNLSTSTDARGAVASYTYDASNRVTSIGYSSGGTTDQTIAFAYDSGTNGKGRLTSASDANHSLSWTYDGLGRVTGKGLTVGSVSLSVGYGYTSGDRTALVTPSGQSVVYGFNSNHQVTSIAVNGTTVLTGVSYEPFAGVNGWSWGDGSATSRTFNGDGLISQIVTAGVTLGYSFDYANRITGISDSSDGTLTWAYGYDALDRLTSASTSAITDGWTYDANGNQLTQTGTTSNTYSITSGSNQLSAVTGGLTRSYSYDAAGNTVGYGSLAFSYNNRGRMAVTTGGSTDYLYNALGQMIEKSGTAGTTIFMQDESGHLIGEYDGSGNLIEETVWLGDVPVATLQPNGSDGVNIFYVHTDHLNAPRKVAQPSTGTLAWRWDADPFGSATPNDNPGGLGTFAYNLRFPGQYYQAETGLNQNWNRDYDPISGKYVESDPIGLPAGINTYSYVGSSPLRRIDLFGLYTTVFISYDSNGIGDHASVYTLNGGPNGEPSLYDPAGGYNAPLAGELGMLVGPDANVPAYIQYQNGSGDTVYAYTFNTTPEQERQIMINAEKQPYAPPFTCSTRVSNTIKGVGPFKNIKPTFFPARLGGQLAALPGVMIFSFFPSTPSQ
jgi:RHS repeat-associated protein